MAPVPPNKKPLTAVVAAAVAKIKAAFAVDVVALVAGVGRFKAATIVVILDAKPTSVFPDKSIQNLFASV